MNKGNQPAVVGSNVGLGGGAPVESWRKLALQFDAQRMAALIHLRTLLDFPEAHAKAAREFLAAAPQPAERVPLTDEQLLALLGDIDADTKRLPPGLKAFARAVEQAHGIEPLNASLSGQSCCIKPDAEK